MSDQERLTVALADRYRIERGIGAGGMATVYLAQDLKHDRKVAVKVLRPELAVAVGSGRFLQEIGIASQLQHPHILTLIDSGEADGFLFYVMPFVDGESLRQKLLRKQELPVDEAVRLLRDVADGLAYAHSQGLVHRDIKPGNVLLSGRHALIVDFGVAKALSLGTPSSAPTSVGVSLGTPTYMSPEQATADPKIDHRADIYAFGVMAYEVLSGEPPITGNSQQAILAAQVTMSPRPVDEVRPAVPPPLAELVMRCLEKRPADRLQSAEDLLQQLEAQATPSLGMTPSSTMPVALGQKRWARWGLMGASAILLVAVAALSMRDRGPPGDLPQPVRRQLTYDGNVGLSALSPDGEYIAYTIHGDRIKLMVQDLEGGTELLIADSIGAGRQLLTWSPDGAHLGFIGNFQGSYGLYVFPRLGGAPRRFPYVPVFTWSPDGNRMAVWAADRKTGLSLRNLASGESEPLNLPGGDRWIEGVNWSPDGDLLVLVTTDAVGPSNLWVLDLEDGTSVLTHADSASMTTARLARGGNSIYYTRGEDLYRIAVNPGTGEADGIPQRIVTLDGVVTLGAGGGGYWLSADGRSLAYTKRTGHTNFSLARLAPGGGIEHTVLTSGTAQRTCPRLSPDGTVLAFLQETGEGTDLFRVSSSGGPPERLTFDGSLATVCPAWGPAGDQLAVVILAGATRKVAVLAATGGTLRVFENTDVSQDLAWAPSQRIAYQLPGNRNFRLLDFGTEDGELLVQNDSVGWIFYPRTSPDERQVAVGWNRLDDRDTGLWLISRQDSSQVRVAEGSTRPIGWSEDGRGLFAKDNSDGAIMRFPLDGGAGEVIPKPELGNADCLPFERSGALVWVCEDRVSFFDVWMIENFDPGLGK